MSKDQQLGDYLCLLRAETGLDLAVLARRVSLSAAQVAQLERGEGSLFYSRRIRQLAARKVIEHLGGDPARVQDEVSLELLPNAPIPSAPSLAAPEPPKASVANLEGTPRTAAPVPVRIWRPMVMLAGVCMVTMAGVLWMRQSDLQPTVQGAVQVASLSVASPVALQPAQPFSDSASTAAHDAPAATSAEPAAQPVKTAASAQTPSCANTDNEQPPRVQPPQAAKPGDMVYLVSKVDQVVCLLDASGKQHQQRLEAGQARSFYGQPPWVVHTAQLRETQIFFQGWKVKLPEDAQDRVQLVELR